MPWWSVANGAPVAEGACRPHPGSVMPPGCVAAVTSELREPGTTLPDLVPNVTWTYIEREFVLDPESQTFKPDRRILRFDTHAQNLGEAALDLMADDPVSVVEGSAVSQCVSWTALVCRTREPVGGFELHPQHQHFHFKDFAVYELRRLDASGAVDWSAAGLIGRSDKVSFCLVDSVRVDETAVPVPAYPACNPVREGISAGWSDIYDAYLEGQSFYVDGLADGAYALVVTLNPLGHVYESDLSDNRVVVRIELYGGATGVRILDRQWSA